MIKEMSSKCYIAYGKRYVPEKEYIHTLSFKMFIFKFYSFYVIVHVLCISSG